MIIYANAAELLSEVNSDGVTIRRWNDDFTEIVMKTEAELAASLDTLRLTLKNDHGIALWKQDGSSVVQRTQEEIAADEYLYTVAHFDMVLFQSDLNELLPDLSNFNLRWEFGALNTFAQNRDFSGMVQYLDLLVSGGVATQQDVDAVKSVITKQGIVL